MTNPESQNQQWSSKSLGKKWQHLFFYALIRYTGRIPAYLFSYLVVFQYVLFKPEVYRRSMHYIRRRFPQDGFFARWIHSWKLCQHFAIALIDKSAVAILGKNTFTYTVKNSETLHNIIAEGKGMILLTSHTGCWQASLAGIADIDTPVHLLMHRDENDVDNQYFEHSQQNHIQIISVADPLASMLSVTKALRNGEVVSIMGDRFFPPTSYTAEVDFLGEPALFPTAAYKIAATTGAPIVLLLTRKIGLSEMEIEVAHVTYMPQKRIKDFSCYAQQVAQVIENYTITSPYQFYNFFDLWSTKDEHNKH